MTPSLVLWIILAFLALIAGVLIIGIIKTRNGHGSDWFIAIATGILTGAIVSFYLTPTGQAWKTFITNYDPKPTCSDPKWLLQVPDSQIFASSYYFQKDNIDGFGVWHDPNSTIDGNVRTAWLQFWPPLSKPKNYSYIEWTFSQSFPIRLICIVNGWTEDRATYTATLPVGKTTIYATDPAVAPPAAGLPMRSSQCPAHKQELQDYLTQSKVIAYVYQWQAASYSCDTSAVVLYIDSVSANSEKLRAGTLVPAVLTPSSLGNYTAPLTGLSEIRFYYSPDSMRFISTH